MIVYLSICLSYFLIFIHNLSILLTILIVSHLSLIHLSMLFTYLSISTTHSCLFALLFRSFMVYKGYCPVCETSEGGSHVRGARCFNFSVAQWMFAVERGRMLAREGEKKRWGRKGTRRRRGRRELDRKGYGGEGERKEYNGSGGK